MRVLVVDDNPDNLALVQDILRQRQYDVLTAHNGPQALVLAREVLPDLIILDVNMPEMNGFEVCARLQEQHETARIPVLMLTALGDIDSRIKGLGLGAEDYLVKPYNPRELLARVDTRLRAKATSDKLRTAQIQIRQTFERFVPAQVVDQLLRHPELVQLGGQLQEITILFADIEGFTSASEHAAPERLLSVLNQYHSLLVEHIRREEGTVDKFLGDGVMALYGAPLPQEDHTLRAVRTAVNIHHVLPGFQERFEPLFRWNINFGIHTGEAIVGNVGTAELMDYTAIGDPVNLASRLEGLAEGNQIVISEAVYERVVPHVIGQRLGPHKIRGRAEPVVVFTVAGLRS